MSPRQTMSLRDTLLQLLFCFIVNIIIIIIIIIIILTLEQSPS